MHIDYLLISYQFYTVDILTLERAMETIAEHPLDSTKIYWVRDLPAYSKNPVSSLLKQHSSLLFRGYDFDILSGISRDKVINKNAPQWNWVLSHTDDFVIDTHKRLYQSDRFITSINGELLMRDSSHLNERLSPQTNQELYTILFGDL